MPLSLIFRTSAPLPESTVEEHGTFVPQPPGENPIIVELDAGDRLSLNGEAVATEALAEQVSERLRHDRQKVVFFKIDDDANYGRAVRVMDICKGAGAATLGIITRDDK